MTRNEVNESECEIDYELNDGAIRSSISFTDKKKRGSEYNRDEFEKHDPCKTKQRSSRQCEKFEDAENPQTEHSDGNPMPKQCPRSKTESLARVTNPWSALCNSVASGNDVKAAKEHTLSTYGTERMIEASSSRTTPTAKARQCTDPDTLQSYLKTDVGSRDIQGKARKNVPAKQPNHLSCSTIGNKPVAYKDHVVFSPDVLAINYCDVKDSLPDPKTKRVEEQHQDKYYKATRVSQSYRPLDESITERSGITSQSYQQQRLHKGAGYSITTKKETYRAENAFLRLSRQVTAQQSVAHSDREQTNEDRFDVIQCLRGIATNVASKTRQMVQAQGAQTTYRVHQDSTTIPCERNRNVILDATKTHNNCRLQKVEYESTFRTKKTLDS